MTRCWPHSLNVPHLAQCYPTCCEKGAYEERPKRKNSSWGHDSGGPKGRTWKALQQIPRQGCARADGRAGRSAFPLFPPNKRSHASGKSALGPVRCPVAAFSSRRRDKAETEEKNGNRAGRKAQLRPGGTGRPASRCVRPVLSSRHAAQDHARSRPRLHWRACV
jgi:hypothetical protein